MNARLARSLTAAVLTGTALLGTVAPASAADGDVFTGVCSGDCDTLRAVFYEHADGSGRQLRYYGGSACSSSTTDTDFSMRVLPSGWNDIISRVSDFNGCDVKLYRDGGLGSALTGYVNYGSGGKYVGGTANDQTSSFTVS
jgi:hypothetical protein